MKPILFNTEMVRSILDGRKTVTRRVIKCVPSCAKEMAVKRWCFYWETETAMWRIKSPYRPGDILYVRETWSPVCVRPVRYLYKADADIGIGEGAGLPIRWRPSIHMPREAARIFLRVENISTCRVQDTTDEDARKEGCANREDFRIVWNTCCAEPRPVKGKCGVITHYESYPWEDIQETRTYRGKPWYVIGNPWVWVIEFERISREEAIMDEL